MPKSEKLISTIVSAAWLEAHLSDENVRVVEASWHMPATGRNARDEFTREHIPGAVFFDIDEHCTASHLPHMLPSAEDFAHAVGKMGISVNDTIVVYDSLGLFSAARVWWMFRHFGAQHVVVLDGGLPAWREAGGKLESFNQAQKGGGQQPTVACEFLAPKEQLEQGFLVVDAGEVEQACTNSDVLILDARSTARFTAKELETREGLVSGHIPNSVSLPFTSLLDDTGKFKSIEQLKALFEAAGLRPHHRVVTSCGSGVTAAVITLALHMVGHPSAMSLYDGSWTEWGSLPAVAVDTGPSKRA